MELLDKYGNIYFLGNYHKLEMSEKQENVKWNFEEKIIDGQTVKFHYKEKTGKLFYFKFRNKWYRIGRDEFLNELNEFTMVRSKARNPIERNSWLNQLYMKIIQVLKEPVVHSVKGNKLKFNDGPNNYKVVLNNATKANVYNISVYMKEYDNDYSELYSGDVSILLQSAFSKLSRHIKF